MRNKKIWITWEQHRRTRELAGSLEDVVLFELESFASRFFRYFILLVRTLFVLVKKRPALVIVQSPSNILALFMVTIGRFFTTKVVIDAHNGGIRPYHALFQLFKPLFRYIHRKSDLVVVTNTALADVVTENGGNFFILEDKLPLTQKDPTLKLEGDINFVSISTFEEDEPFEEIIKSAALLDEKICIYITGDYSKVDNIVNRSPKNVILTGFLPESDYIRLLSSSNAVIDLTSAPDCLVCGAYEAVSLEKPLILSDDPALRYYFNKGVIFTRNQSKYIAEAISQVITSNDKLQVEVKQLKEEITVNWQKKIEKFNHLLDKMIGG